MYSKKLVYTICIIGIVVLHHLYGYLGHYGYDDMAYARVAKQMADGKFKVNDNPDTYRWGVVVPTAISYKLFGVNDHASAIPPMLVTIITLLVLLCLCRKQKHFIVIITLLLLCLNPWTLSYSDKIMPDIYVALSAISAITVLYHHKYLAAYRSDFKHALLFSGCLFFGFISKETILLLLPVFFFIFLSDIIQKKDTKFWIYAILISFFLLLFYFSYIKYETGAFFTRFAAIQSWNFHEVHSYEHKSIGEFLRRITYGLFFDFTEQSMVTALLFSIPAILAVKYKNLICMNEGHSFLATTLLLSFLSACYMTTSPDHYIPMPADERHYLFLIPLSAVVGAPAAYHFFVSKKHKNVLLIASLLIAILAYVNNYQSASYIYFPLFVLVCLRYVLPDFRSPICGYLFLIAFIGILMVQPIKAVKDARSVGYTAQQTIVNDYFKESKERNLVITNPAQKNISEYYLEFDSSATTQFIGYKEVRDYRYANNTNIFLLLNRYTSFLSGLDYEDLPVYARRVPPSFLCLYKDEKIQFYKGNSIEDLLNVKERLYMESKNDFEKEYDNWKIDSVNIIDTKAFSGARSYKVPQKGFSGLYCLNMNQLYGDSVYNVSVKAKVFATAEENAEAALVIVVEENGEALYWQAVTMGNFNNGEIKWKPFEIDRDLPRDLSKTSQIKIYVWNTGDEPVIIDDFRVALTGD